MITKTIPEVCVRTPSKAVIFYKFKYFILFYNIVILDAQIVKTIIVVAKNDKFCDMSIRFLDHSLYSTF